MSRLHRASLLLAGALCALAIACSSGDSAPSPTATADPLTTVATVEGTRPPAPGESEPPLVTITAGGGGAVPMHIGTYCWGGICADAIGIITAPSPIAASAGDELTFAGSAFDEALSAISLQLWTLPEATVAEGSDWEAWRPETTATTLEVVNAVATLPADLAPGRYLLSLFVSFTGGGDASYGIVIDTTS